MSKKAKNIQAVNARWSVNPEGERTWHAKFAGTKEDFPVGTVLWVDRYTEKTKETEVKEVIVVDHIKSDFKTKKPAVFAAYMENLTDEEVEDIKSGKIHRGRRKVRTDGIKQTDIERLEKKIDLILEHLGIDNGEDDGVPF